MGGYKIERRGKEMKTTKVLSALIIGMMIVSSIPWFATAQEADDTLVIALQQDMVSMNPWDPDTNDVWKTFQIGWNFETLMAYNPDYELYPVLAAPSATGPNGADAWISADGTQVSVNIRTGVTFHDGTPMNATDVVFSYQTLAWGLFQTQVLTPLEWDTAIWDRYDGGTTHIGVELNSTAPDTRVDFHLSQPYAMFWYLTMAVPIMPYHIWNDHTLDQAGGEKTWDYSYGSDVTETDATIGTGPMMLESWTKEQGSVIVAYENYWDKDGVTTWKGVDYPNYPSTITTINFKIYTQLDVAILALQNGDVHHLPWSLTPGYYNLLKTDPNIGIETNKDQGFFFMTYNMRKGAMADVNFRRAVAYCVDKQYIVDRLMGGYGIQGSVPMSVTNTYYVNTTVPDWIAGGDLEAAKALLDASGYTDQDGDGWRDQPDGSPLKYNILTPPKDYDPIRADSGIMIEKNLKSIGLNIASVPTSFDTIVSAGFVSLDFDMFILGWTVGSFPESYMADFFHSDYDVAINPAGSNSGGYHNTSVDSMIEEMDITMDTEDRAKLIKDICGATMMDVAYNTLYYRTNIEAYRKDVWQGWVPAFGTIYNGFSVFNLAAPTDGGDDGGDGNSGGSATITAIDGTFNMPSMAGAGQTISGSVLAAELVTVDGVAKTQPCAAASVKIETSLGQFINGTTDANGVLAFEVTVPYQKISSFDIDANISKSGAWTNINKTIGIEFTNHIAQLSLSTDDGVIAPSGTTTVTAIVTDENGDPLAGIDVTVDTALMFGTVDDDIKTTNADGTATFEYTAPPVNMLPNTHRFEQFKATIFVPGTIIPEVQSASLTIGISSDLYDWHDLDITDVTAYVLDQAGETSTNITLELTDQDGAVISDFPVSVAFSDDGILDADAAVKNTNATGMVTFTITLDGAYDGAGAVIATFNTSKAYSIKDSVALYINNDPTFTVDTYHLNVTGVTRDVIYNHYNNTDNTTTITVTLFDDAWAPVDGIDLYMGLSDDSLVEVSAEFETTDANGSASYDITCIANGSANISVVFGNEGGVGIYEGYNLKVNKTTAPIGFNEVVAGEHVFGPSAENSRYWHVLANTPTDTPAVKKINAAVWTNLVAATDYSFNLTTGNISYINKLATGDSVSVWYNYTQVIVNETVVADAIGGETYALLNHTKILTADIYKNDSGGVWTKMAWTTDYTIDNATGNVTFVAALTAGDDIFAYYNYTNAWYEVVFAGPAVAGEVGPWNLAHTPNNAATILKEATPLTVTTDYTLAGTTLTLVNPLINGEDIYANYNWTRDVAGHRLDVTDVSSYVIDNNPFGDATPDNTTITVQLTATDGTPVEGVNITAIEWVLEPITLVNTYAITNATGHATFTVESASDDEFYAAVYFLVKDTAGITESVSFYNAPYTPGYAADIDFTGVADHDSLVDITATVYDAAGAPAVGVPCQFFIPPTAEGIPGLFEGGDSWGFYEYGGDNDMSDYAGYLGSWFEGNATVTDGSGQLVATINTASFISDTEIPLQFGVGGTGTTHGFTVSANNFWWEDPYTWGYPASVPPMTDGADGEYYWMDADFTMTDQVILLRAPMATLTKVTMDQTFLSAADNSSTVSLTFQNLAGALDTVTVNFGEGTAKPTILDEAATTVAGVYTYDYTANVGDFDAGIGFTSVVTDSNYAKFPFNFYLPYLTDGTIAKTFVVSIVPADVTVNMGENVTLDVVVMDEYGRLISGASVVSGLVSDTTDASGVAQLIIPTTSVTESGIFGIAFDVSKGTISTEESVSVNLLAVEVVVVMVDIIIGPVLDADGNPIVGATVIVTFGGVNYTGVTNATGYATIAVPESALGEEVTVTISAEGYETVTYTTTLNNDGTLAADLPTLEKAEEEGGISMMLVAIIVIVIVVVIVVALVVLPKMKGGKPESTTPKEETTEEPAEEAPQEETPAETPAEETPKEE